MVVASGQQYNNVGEKPTVILYTYYIIIAMQVHQNKRKKIRGAEIKQTQLC